MLPQANVFHAFRLKLISQMYALPTAKRSFCQIDANAQISSWLIDGSKRNNSLEQDRFRLNGDSGALIAAGRLVPHFDNMVFSALKNFRSDTVASTMIYLFYRLALERRHAFIICEEVDKVDSIFDPQALKGLDHLNGAINEVLRLHPSVPTGGCRESPPQGVEIAGHSIPGNTTIVSPRYTMGRRMCFFSFSLQKLLMIRAGLLSLSHCL